VSTRVHLSCVDPGCGMNPPCPRDSCWLLQRMPYSDVHSSDGQWGVRLASFGLTPRATRHIKWAPRKWAPGIEDWILPLQAYRAGCATRTRGLEGDDELRWLALCKQLTCQRMLALIGFCLTTLAVINVVRGLVRASRRNARSRCARAFAAGDDKVRSCANLSPGLSPAQPLRKCSLLLWACPRAWIP